MLFFNSRYNFAFPTSQGYLVYNARTGGTALLPSENSSELVEYLRGDKAFIDERDIDKDTLMFLNKNGFIVPEGVNELLEIEERYLTARNITPVVLTITTTMDCNLGCYYCFESRTKHKLETNKIPEILEFIRLTFDTSPSRSLHVDWYGGEPLLNYPFLNECSLAIQDFCRKASINYHASIISNGTEWPDDVETFIRTHQIRQVQISFDGLEKNHDKRRRYRKEYSSVSTGSFEKAIELVDQLLNFVHVDIRFNIDKNNRADLIPFVHFIKGKGWFDRRYRAVLQPACISGYTEKASFLKTEQLNDREFEALKDEALKHLADSEIQQSEIPDYFPYPKNYVCAALARNSNVLGAEGLVYKCGLQVGEVVNAVGKLTETGVEYNGNIEWWNNFNPCKAPTCSSCSFLPICFGGCAKKHLDHDQKFLDEQSEYWRNNLGKTVSRFLKIELLDSSPLLSQDQFRNGFV